jgi:hypothetical protein
MRWPRVSRREELAWAAGLFEGEGNFYRPPTGGYQASLSMTDEDSVLRFQRAVGFGLVVEQKRRAGLKTLYRWRVANFQHVQALAALLWPGLGARRRAAVRATITRREFHGYPVYEEERA